MEASAISSFNQAHVGHVGMLVIQTMKTHSELRSLTHRAILATAALAPFALGTGRDSHGHPVPNAEAVIRHGLLALVEAGRLAQVALEDSDALAGHPDAIAEVVK